MSGAGEFARMSTYQRFMLLILLVILAFNYVDRLALGLLMQPIKDDLLLSDTQLGLISGLAFALFYSVMGIPIARWADRGDRVKIITLTTALWSVAVALCGMASSFIQLAVIRVLVAVGEAGCVPPAHSLIGDEFARAIRAKAVAIYMLGVPISMLIGYLGAGWLNEWLGWRMTFVALGLPGLALAGIAFFCLREPRRRGMREAFTSSKIAEASTLPVPGPNSAREVIQTLWSNRTFRQLTIGYSIAGFFGNGIAVWKAAFFIRSYGFGTGELGTWFAMIWGVGGIIGTYLGGVLATRLAANNEALQLKAIAFGYAVFGVFSVGIYTSSGPELALTLMALSAVGISAVNGPLFAIFQTIIPGNKRATALAVIYLFTNLIGLGLGPLAAGALSDLLAPSMGDESLRYALLILCPGYAWCGYHMWRGSKKISEDIAAIHDISESDSQGQDANSEVAK